LKGDYDNSIKYYSFIIGLDPGNLNAYLGRAYSYNGKGLLDEEIDNLVKAMKLGNPIIKDAGKIKNHLTDAYYFRALIYGNDKNFDKEIEYMEIALEYNPALSEQIRSSLANAYLSRANVYKEEHVLEKAKEYEDKAKRICPDLPMHIDKSLREKVTWTTRAESSSSSSFRGIA
jgi:tetratricopeptide (TPR) repeat protein